MAIYLVQHGKAKSKDQDPQRPLTSTGIKETMHIASVAEYYMIEVDSIEHSGKLRARQTADIIGNKLNLTDKVKEIPGIAPNDDVKAFAQNLSPESDRMFIGHLPFMEKLVSFLTTGSDKYKVFKFQNSGIVCLDKQADDEFWHIKWSLLRNIS
jgi:phosphohistidine phosphatase